MEDWQVATVVLRLVVAVACIVGVVRSKRVFDTADNDNRDQRGPHWNSRMFVIFTIGSHYLCAGVWNVVDAGAVASGQDSATRAGVSALLFTCALGWVSTGIVSRVVYWRQVLTTKNLLKLKDVRTTLPLTLTYVIVFAALALAATGLAFTGSVGPAVALGAAAVAWYVVPGAVGTLYFGALVQDHLNKSGTGSGSFLPCPAASTD
jgi:hypothetical protein